MQAAAAAEAGSRSIIGEERRFRQSTPSQEAEKYLNRFAVVIVLIYFLQEGLFALWELWCGFVSGDRDFFFQSSRTF